MPRDSRAETAPHALVCEDHLVLDPRILLDARFLGILKRELRGRLGAREAQAVLLQSGFFHGRLEASRTLRGPEGASSSLSPLLPMTLDSVRGEGVGVRGTWPGRLEAEAYLASSPAGEAPACLVSAGYTSGWLSGIWDAPILAVEESCAACGAETCSFRAREAAAWRSEEDPRVRPLLSALPFAALEELVQRHVEAEREEPDPPCFDRSSPAIHVWGPVMVIPYSGEETACSVDLIVRDPAAGEISVVIVDLCSAVIDSGFGAVALERTLETITSFGAEPVLAGVTPLSEPVIRDIGRPQLVLRKDLGEAIATAFQIVESQRHPT